MTDYLPAPVVDATADAVQVEITQTQADLSVQTTETEVVVATVQVAMPTDAIFRGLQGIQGPRGDIGPLGDGTALELVAGQDLNAYHVVRQGVTYASAENLDAGAVIGVTKTASLAGEIVQVVTSGVVENAGWSWVPGEALYLGLNGQITPAQVGAVSLYVGYAMTPTSMFVRIGRAILRG